MTTMVATTALLDDAALVQRIFDHIDHRTTDLASSTWREPVANYRSEARLTAEVEQVLRRAPTPFCPSAALPEPGSYLARDAAGVPLVAVRAHDGTARVFRNACRHRGTAIASGSGNAPSLVCPYHGWVYRLDGSLRLVPDEHGFPGLDKECRGLVGVSTVEHGGVVFVTQDSPEVPGVPVHQLPELIAPDQRLFATGNATLDVNWKVFLEGFLEGYHIKATHRETFFPLGFDNLNVIEQFGRNSRVVFPFRRIETLRSVPAVERRMDGMAAIVHHLFPNVLIVGLSHHTSMVVLEPLTIDRTRMITYNLTSRGRSGDSRENTARDVDFLQQGTAEDQAMALAVQRGMASGANETLEFGRFEGAIGHFHRQMHALLDGAD